MLHIVTPLYRYENLPKVYASIPKHKDITWHIAKTKRRMGIDLGVKLPQGGYSFDQRIRLYEIDCDDTDVAAKYNSVFARVKDGYFVLLDDDTAFVERMYDKYKELEENKFKGMFIGDQINANGSHRIYATTPEGGIAAGNVICHSAALEEVKWKAKILLPAQFTFWSDCRDFFGSENAIKESVVISVYNALRNEESR